MSIQFDFKTGCDNNHAAVAPATTMNMAAVAWADDFM
jgi:hypothetical protein